MVQRSPSSLKKLSAKTARIEDIAGLHHAVNDLAHAFLRLLRLQPVGTDFLPLWTLA